MPHYSSHITAQQSYLLLTAYLTPLFMSLSMFAALVLRKHKNKALVALKWVMLAIAGASLLYISKFFLLHTPYHYPVLTFYSLFFGIAVTPIPYFYIVALLRPTELNIKLIAQHYIPLVTFAIAYIVLILMGNISADYFDYDSLNRDIALPINTLRVIMLITFVTMRAGYVFAMAYRVHKHQQAIRLQYSYTKGVNLKWVYWALLAYLALAISPILVTMFTTMQMATQLTYVLLNMVAALIYFFSGYYQPDIYTDEHKAEAEAVVNDSEVVERNSLSAESRERLKADLLSLFENDKRFQSPILSIDDIAKDLRSNRTYISRVINEEFGTNFYAFVNTYRMAEFMHRLHTHKDINTFKIKEVSNEVGFKSYTSFFNFFREQKGVTPSEYLKKRQGEAARRP